VVTSLEGFIPYRSEDADKYNKLRWWSGLTFGDVLDKAADVYPDKEALVDGISRLTYSQLREKTDRLAIGLMELGIKKQDRVLVQVPNWNEFIYSYFALQKIGAIVVLLIAKYKQAEINHLCRLTSATAWIVPETYKKINYIPIINDVMKTNPNLKQVILVRGAKSNNYLNMEDLIEKADLSDSNRRKLAARRPDPMEVAHMGSTGGSTGLPKVAPHIHNSYVCRSEYTARAWELNVNDSCLIVAPTGHDLSFGIGICPTIFAMGKLVMLDSTDTDDILSTIQQEKITAVAWVPTLASRLVNAENLQNYDISSLRKMYCGGQASLTKLVKDVSEKVGCKYINAYGGTEGMGAMTRLHFNPEDTATTVGKPVCPYDTYKIIGENEEELPAGTPGELVVKGPCIFTGYYYAPDENEKAFTKDGFFKTGDQATIDVSGKIRITSRIKDIIIRGGENISPIEIEELIINHPDVLKVSVIGMPDPVLSERVCAYVQPKVGVKLSFEDVISFLKDKKISVLHLPERIEFIDDMPLTEAQKPDKKKLRKDIEKKLAASGIN